MGLIDFVKAAGRSLGIGTADAAPTADELKKEAASHGLDVSGVDVAVDGDKVTVKGGAKSQEEKEKIILAMGNVAGVAKVEDQIAPAVAAEAEGASFYTVEKGDTLSAIAKAQYGDASKYPAIFEANKPMLKHPDKIYPGQVLRIPRQG
ncbi:peptidoglycan-binding protein LysM [Geminicoccus harenae]|uniref:peptidoglycan-binding protein LysM n=1 Tax=Geminicoccus harenae TaxID=2498453 RepID=UPI00168B9F67|nr:peptidoglycan-binding protein LysM [Geminicoccus harenae]